MSGIYIHIPFCKQACAYCNFHFTTSLRYKNELVAALLSELKLQYENKYLSGAPVESIYFGGGTPSLLNITDIASITEIIHQQWNVNPAAEITLEANPDDVTNEKLNGWKAAGINRLSIGIQSLYEEDLRWMNRAHTADEARNVIEKARHAGFNQFSIDFIYGTPFLTDEQWQEELEWVTQQQIEHISCYALTVEQQTPLAKKIEKKELQSVEAEKQSRQFLQLMQYMHEAGYEHYEISNFALPGHRSKHNSSYWKGIPYLGIGPAAHSFNGSTRQWNVANNQQYIRDIKNGIIPATTEELTPVQQLNEYIMISIRTMEGSDLKKVDELRGTYNKQGFEQQVNQFVATGWMLIENNSIILTKEGKLFADKIAADLFF